MKKQNVYSTIYGLLLVLFLATPSLTGQVVYNSNNVLDHSLERISTNYEKEDVKINTSAIITISSHLRNEINLIKDRVGLHEKGRWIAKVLIGSDGTIKSVSVSGLYEVSTIIKNIIFGLKKVEPITYDGMAKEKTIQIPVVIEKR
ncbi:MAG: hypothetical protein V3V00_00935 [Saprospiraceae bacterium]